MGKLAIWFGVMFLGRRLFFRSLGCLFWILVAVLALFLGLPALKAGAQELGGQPDLVVGKVVQLAPEFQGRLQQDRRRPVRLEQAFSLPDSLPPGFRVLLSGSADGMQPFVCDDLCRVSLFGQQGRSFSLEHDFRSQDGSSDEPFGPVDLTGMVPMGDVRSVVEVEDITPPLHGSSAFYLVILMPQGQSLEEPGQEAATVAEDDSNAAGSQVGQDSKAGGGDIFPQGLAVGLGVVALLLLGFALRSLFQKLLWARASRGVQ